MKGLATQCRTGLSGWCAGLLLGLAGAAQADDDTTARYPVGNAVYRAECGGCHVAFPPGLLSARAWRTLMGALDKHFGSDARVDEPTRIHIADFLQVGAGLGASLDAGGREVL